MVFKKIILILWIYRLVNTTFKKTGEQITGYSISEINKKKLVHYIYIYIYTEWD